MGEAPLILGVSGLRGIVGESLTPEVAARYAASFGGWLKGRTGHNPSVAVGRDGRAGGEEIERVVVEALVRCGCNVEPCGVAMTPSMGHEVDHCAYDAAVVVTASHNPSEWNGLKILLSPHAANREVNNVTGTSAPTAQDANEIIERFRSPPAPGAVSDGSVGIANDPVLSHVCDIDAAMSSVVTRADRGSIQTLRAAVDSVNCSGAIGAAELARALGFTVDQLNGNGTGVFPHLPEPTRENLSCKGGLCDAVPGLKADVGFAQDPDADRLAIVDEKGSYIGEEYTLVLAAVALLEARGSDGATGRRNDEGAGPVIVTNLSTSRMIDDVAARFGARVERTAVGEANVVERMMALRARGEDVILGGEGNGGVIWPEVVYVRDSLSAMALTLALMARTGKTVSELVAWVNSMAGGTPAPPDGHAGGTPAPPGVHAGGTPAPPGYSIVKRKVEIASRDAARPAVEAVVRAYSGADGASVDTQDGVRVDWPGRRAWVHVRASNTEPIMRLIAEAGTQREAEEILAEVEGVIARG